jgi:hypothetical protein
VVAETKPKLVKAFKNFVNKSFFIARRGVGADPYEVYYK